MKIFFHRQDGVAESLIAGLLERLRLQGFTIGAMDDSQPLNLGLCVSKCVSPGLHDVLRSVRQAGAEQVIVIMEPNHTCGGAEEWSLLQSGASDVLAWTDPEQIVAQIRARFERWLSIEVLLQAQENGSFVVGKSPTWRAALHQIIEIARFSDTAALILGESGTGKELAARLLHELDPRPDKRDLVVQDCSTLVTELSGSEFFGHERGAFTGAHTERHGVFALANAGTLFLDEIGELPPLIQGQLLRVIQEHSYKRVGGSTWHRTNFRLISATNRNLLAMVERGEFRADLYHRIAGHVCELPPLSERPEDVLPLALSFIRQMAPDRRAPTLDPLVHDYLLQRSYPGNVRELKQVVSRLMSRCGADGTLSIGYVPREERPATTAPSLVWADPTFETAIRRAVLMGAGLKEIGRAAEDCAIRCATGFENGSLRRAAQRLGVTDRALQLRRAQTRNGEAPGFAADGRKPH